MNFAMVLYIVGWLLEFESALLLLPAIVALVYREPECILAYVITALISFFLGAGLKRFQPKSKDLYMREGFVTVAFGWIFLSLIGALPFVFTRDIPNYIDALFETISGFTTTGASILSDVEHLHRSALFWRSFTHWIGGMGVFVFIMAVLPLMGGSTMNLMRAESTGPSVGKLVPRVRDSAKILYEMYVLITVAAVVTYLLCGMDLYTAMTLTFGTVGTGGFGVLNTSIGSYGAAAQWAITIFMILSGINYSVYFYLLRKQWKDAFSIEEVRVYLFLLVAGTAVITGDIFHLYRNLGESVRHAAFQVASIITTTGFSTTDFDLWPSLSKTILVAMMFIGSCSGSTAGGIKISRIIILVKTINKELSNMIHPRQVQKIRMDGRSVAHDTLRNTNVYMVSYVVILVASILLISLDEYDFTTNFTAVTATLNNIGPGLNLVGPTQNFAIYSPLSKIVLMFDMLAGRLELFPMLILLKPSCWKKY